MTIYINIFEMEIAFHFLVVLFLHAVFFEICTGNELYPNGFLIHCPCMGYFGNQADNLLSSMAFAKALNRTFLIPPWVEYEKGNPRSVQKPYKTYFDPKAIMEYQSAMTMEDFMANIASDVWPPHKRICNPSYCYRTFLKDAKPNDCNSKQGNPFGSFWDTFNVDFVGSEFYPDLSLTPQTNKAEAEKWNRRFPSDKYPVLAFTGAPALFPVRDGDTKLQKYIRWNQEMLENRDVYIKNYLGNGDYVSVHLRSSPDFLMACDMIEKVPQLFAVAQCVGHKNEFGMPTKELCNPSFKTIHKQVNESLKETNAKYLYVASNTNGRVAEFAKVLTGVTIIWNEDATPHEDLMIMGKAKHFIGNCVSTFSSFVKRERDANELPSSFFAFPLEKYGQKDEL